MDENPFRYTAPVQPRDVVDRDEETRILVGNAVSGNNSRLVAPRRFGKTSLLGRVQAELPKGWVSVYVDFFGVLSIGDVAERVERAYVDQLTGRLRTWFASVRRTLKPTLRAGGGVVPVGVEVSVGDDGTPSLLDRLALPRLLHEKHGKRVLVVFDEFQDVLAAGRNVDALIRSEIQHHGEAASYVFAGSEVAMMSELFTGADRAFYAQAGGLGLRPLADADLAAHVARRFESTGRDVGAALDPYLDFVRGHPQRAMCAANLLWAHTPRGGVADAETWSLALDAARAQVAGETQATWLGLTSSQQRVLATLAEGRSPYGGGRVGTARGGAVKSALDRLASHGIVTEDRVVVDPFLADWVRRMRHPGTDFP